MAWYASVAKVGHSTSGLTTTITFRVTQRVDGNSYDAVGWDVRWNASTGASGPLRFAINKNQTVTRDFSVSVGHNSSTGIAPNVTVTVSNLREGNYINSVVSKSASFQPPKVNVTKVPPQVSNVKLTRNSDSQLTINWTNNGSGNTAPNHNYVDIKTDDGSWVCIHNGGTKTSHVWTGASKGHKYQARVNSGNSAGHNTHVESNIVYTAPNEPTIQTAIVSKKKDESYDIICNFSKSNIKYSSTKIELEYTNDETFSSWEGQQGDSNNPFVNNNAPNSIIINSASDSYLKNYLIRLEEDNSYKMWIRIRAFNTDNSLSSSWTEPCPLIFSKFINVNFYIPDEEVYAIAKTANGPKVYTAKVPKSFFKNDSTQGGWKNAIMGDKLAAIFNLPGRVKDPLDKNGFYPAIKQGTKVGYLDIRPTTVYGLSDVDGAIFNFKTISSTDIEQEDFFNSYMPFDWRYYLEGVDLNPIANSSTTINIQSPGLICDTPYTVDIQSSTNPSQKNTIQFLAPKIIVDNSIIIRDNADSLSNGINMLDWIYQKGKYVSGPLDFVTNARWSVIPVGRFYELGLLGVNGELLAHLPFDSQEENAPGLLSLREGSKEITSTLATGYWGEYENAHKDMFGNKDPQIFIRIPGTKTYTTYNHPSAGDGGYNFTLRFPDDYRGIRLINNDATTTIYTIYKAVQDGYLQDVTIENESIVKNSYGSYPMFSSPSDGFFNLYCQTSTGVYDEFALPSSGINPLNDSTVSFHKINSGVLYPNNNLGKIPVTDLYSQIYFE